jgi:aerobic-type carbon monoxide dehydrogenase small subunit (CoxS/CutS family)
LKGSMASKLKIKVNGLVHSVTASLDTPLLYVLHNELKLHGPRFGCGLAQWWCLLGVVGWEGDPFVCDAGCRCERQGDHDA